MTPTPILDSIPIGALYLLIVVAALIVAEGSYRLGLWWRRRSGDESEGVANPLVGATLALLAFLIVFQTGGAADRHNTRRQLVVEEGKAVGTAFLRAGFLPEPDQTEVRQLLREYVDIRLAAAAEADSSLLAGVVTRSEEIHAELWSLTEAVALAHPGSELIVGFVESLNLVIDVHADRIAAVLNRLQPSIWLAILFVTALSVAVVGFHNGLAGERHLVAAVALVLVMVAVILLIVDLDRPQEGLLQVSQQTLIDLQRQFETWP